MMESREGFGILVETYLECSPQLVLYQRRSAITIAVANRRASSRRHRRPLRRDDRRQLCSMLPLSPLLLLSFTPQPFQLHLM